jgi:hypothetical protein
MAVDGGAPVSNTGPPGRTNTISSAGAEIVTTGATSTRNVTEA